MTAKQLFDPDVHAEVKQRILSLQSDSPRQWGTMDAAQAFAHCTRGLQMAMGHINPPRAHFPGNILGVLIKPLVIGGDKPMRRNSPSARELFAPQSAPCDFDRERTQLLTTVESFATQGPAGCSRHPHPFFGRLQLQQWAIVMYKHLDHHLRQFNA